MSVRKLTGLAPPDGGDLCTPPIVASYVFSCNTRPTMFLIVAPSFLEFQRIATPRVAMYISTPPRSFEADDSPPTSGKFHSVNDPKASHSTFSI